MRRASVCTVFGMCVCVCLNVAVCAGNTRFRAGLRNAPGVEQLSVKQLQQVLQSLRDKTGWQSLYFDEEAFLVCPEPAVFSGGSAAARRLLWAALTSTAAYDLESHQHSRNVTFARLAPAVDFESRRTGARISAYPLQLDFADFQQLRGDGLALKAFDLGLVIFHELGHAVWRLHDAAQSEDEPGECESFINLIRRELQLPERQNYLARVRSGTLNLMLGTRLIAELYFARTSEKRGQAKQERFLLQWEAETVGIISKPNWNAKPGLTAAFH
ncbi:MAG: hypothetical protein HYR56_29025 [Acidobacteria bacterium]|nr:hypothetical protein [Acidobacteriota bacterium]MBI3426035.1 hypothetical protein [Acidobacteriota bacterium]